MRRAVRLPLLPVIDWCEVLRILVFNPISNLRYGDFDINLAAGLEDSLIAEFSPPWNGRERGHAPRPGP